MLVFCRLALNAHRQSFVRAKKIAAKHQSLEPGRAFELQKASLLRTAQVAVIVDDIAVALVVIIQFRVVPTAVAGLATRMQIIAAGMDFFAGLNVRTVRAVDRQVSARAAIRSGGDAAEVAIIVDDLALTFSIVIQFRVVPIAICCLTARFQIIAVALDVLAGPRVSISSYGCGISALVSTWIAIACAGDALQVAVIVQDVAVAFVVVIQLGFVPAAIASLAARVQIVASYMDILARLRIRSARAVPRLISAGAVTGRSATEHSVIVRDVAAAALHIRKLRVDPVATAVLAICGKNVSIHSNVVARLLV
jgi:hypothetical protein